MANETLNFPGGTLVGRNGALAVSTGTGLPDATAFALDAANALDAGDVAASTLEIDGSFRVIDGTGIFQAVTLYDKDDQGVELYLFVLDANVSLGTIDSAPAISDTDGVHVLGIVKVESTDWLDLGGLRVAQPTVKPFGVRAASGTTKLYYALRNGSGTPTFSAAGLLIRPTILQDQ